MLADATTALPNPSHFASIGWIVVGLAGLVVIGRNALGFWRELTRPTGSDAMAHAATRFQPVGDYVTREEFDAKLNELSRDLQGIRTEMGDMEQRIGDASDERIRRVHERLDTMPDRIITILTNLGVLRRPGQ